MGLGGASFGVILVNHVHDFIQNENNSLTNISAVSVLTYSQHITAAIITANCVLIIVFVFVFTIYHSSFSYLLSPTPYPITLCPSTPFRAIMQTNPKDAHKWP